MGYVVPHPARVRDSCSFWDEGKACFDENDAKNESLRDRVLGASRSAEELCRGAHRASEVREHENVAVQLGNAKGR